MASHGVTRTSGSKPASEQARKKELRKIEEYKTLVDQVNEDVRSRPLSLDVLQETSKLLQINPEYYTVWNYRRLILRYLFSNANIQSQPIETENRNSQGSRHIEELISNELEFLIPLLLQYPKCYWIWGYRSWLLNESIRSLPSSTSRRFWQQELGLASKMLNRDNRNFHGWGYRCAIIKALESSELRSEGDDTSMTEAEFKYTTKMIESNLSNFSAWHNRSKILPRLLNEQQADGETRLKMLDAELELVQRALYTDPDDQSLWFYYQTLVCTFDPAYAGSGMVPNMSKEQQVDYVLKEIDMLVDMLDGAEDCKWIYQSLLQLCTMHKEIDSDWPPQRREISAWVEELRKLDPLRAGRWADLKSSLEI